MLASRQLLVQVTCNQGGLMVEPLKSRSSKDKVRLHRARMRQRGLRPIQVWVPDIQAAAFQREAHRQSLAVARSAHAEADQAFIDAISE